MQGGKLALVDSSDFVIIIMGHAKMSCLRHAAGNTHVEVNSGGAAVIARAVQADTIGPVCLRIVRRQSVSVSLL